MVCSMSRWVDKVAIVTGASSGIGAAICNALVDKGLIVAGIARRVELIEKNANKMSSCKKGKLYAVKADISKEEDVLQAFRWVQENLGPIYILINNAGYFADTLLTDGSTEEWRKQFDINVLGLCVATREAVKNMKANGVNGHIIHINSITGHYVPPIPKMNVYAASKHAVTALTETLRQELKSLGSKIKVTSVSPGLVRTEMTVLNKRHSDETRKKLESLPVLQTEDIADAIVYVLSTPEHVQVHEVTIKPVGENM